MLGGHIVQSQQYHGHPQQLNSNQVKGYNNHNQISGITVIKENNIVMGSNNQHVLSGGQVPQTNMMGRRLADQGHGGTLNSS